WPANGKSLAVERNHRAIRQHVQFALMRALGFAVQPLGVKHFIHRTRRRPFLRSRKQRRKSFSILTPTFEAGPMTRGKGRHLVEKKQLRIAITPNRATPIIEVEFAADPPHRFPLLRCKRTSAGMKSASAASH